MEDEIPPFGPILTRMLKRIGQLAPIILAELATFSTLAFLVLALIGRISLEGFLIAFTLILLLLVTLVSMWAERSRSRESFDRLYERFVDMESIQRRALSESRALHRVLDDVVSVRSFDQQVDEVTTLAPKEPLKPAGKGQPEGAGTSSDDVAVDSRESVEPPVSQDAGAVLSVYRQVATEFAHSIRTPLASVKIAVENLNDRLPLLLGQEQSMPDESSRILLRLLENARESITYTEVVLQRGAGFLPVEPENIVVGEVVRKAVRMVRDATRLETRIEVSVDDMPPLRFRWLNLIIALTQVLENAFEAAGPNGLVRVVGKMPESVEIDIINSGRPIPTEAQEKLFEGGFSTKGPEHGQGLSIAFQALKRAGGEVSLVESNDDETTFRLSFGPANSPE